MTKRTLIQRIHWKLNPHKRSLLRTRPGRAFFRAVFSSKPTFSCPLCGYSGPFVDISPPKGTRRHAQCAQCWAGERHRLQFLVFRQLAEERDLAALDVLHVAPDKVFRALFEDWFKSQLTGDLVMPGVDRKIDLTDLPFEDASFDVVFASHVLEHIKEDQKAVSEVRRVLRPGGFAILPVPLFGPKTVEYPEPNPYDDDHWRAPGPDYFDRYRADFARVELRRSADYPEVHQLHLVEDRTGFPTARLPLRLPMSGERHEDIVPIAWV